MGDTEPLHRAIDSTMSRLAAVWDEVGILGEQRDSRCGVVLLHVTSLLEDMVREEEALRDRLMHNVHKHGAELLQLCTELDMPVYKPEEGLTTLQLECRLRTLVESLTKEKEERLGRLRHLTKLDQQLCARMGTVQFSQCSHQGSVPSASLLDKFEAHVDGLKLEQTKRIEELTALRGGVKRMLEDLSLSPNTSFENEVVYNTDGMKLTLENLKCVRMYHTELAALVTENSERVAALWEELKSLWERLEVEAETRRHFEQTNQGFSHGVIIKMEEEILRCERLKKQHMSRFVAASRSKLVTLWDKCYVESERRQAFKPFFTEDLDDEVLDEHEREIKNLEQYYVEHKELIEKVDKRQQMWSQLLDLENRASNPDRYLNRGCSLLKEEKARKKLAAELPKLELEISRFIDSWQKRSGRRFLVFGSSFDEFVEQERSEYIREKENLKIQRQQQKAQQMEEEILYGSRPVTPTCRRYAGPGSTPTKTPKSGVKPTTAQNRLGRFMSALTPNKTPKNKGSVGVNRLESIQKKFSMRDRSKNRMDTESPVSLPPRSVLREKNSGTEMMAGKTQSLDYRGAYF